MRYPTTGWAVGSRRALPLWTHGGRASKRGAGSSTQPIRTPSGRHRCLVMEDWAPEASGGAGGIGRSVHGRYTRGRQVEESNGRERSRAVTRNRRSASQHSRYQAALAEAGRSRVSPPRRTLPWTVLCRSLPPSYQVLSDLGLALQPRQSRLLVHAGHLLARRQASAHDRDDLAVGSRLLFQRPRRPQDAGDRPGSGRDRLPDRPAVPHCWRLRRRAHGGPSARSPGPTVPRR